MVIDECVSILELVNIYFKSVKKLIKNGKLFIYKNEKNLVSWFMVCKYKWDWLLDLDD